MKVATTYKHIIKLALPISASLIIPQVNFFTNTTFLGRYGERELAVNGVAGLFYLILMMVGYGLASGIQVMLSRRAGEGDHRSMTKIFMSGGMLTIFVSLCLMMLSLWLAPLIFGLFLHHDEHVVLSIRFIYSRVWGLPFLMMTQLINSFFIVNGKSRYLMVGSAVSTILNIWLDWVFIFGHQGAPEMGLQGAALASVISEIAACGVMFGLFYFRKMYRLFPLKQYMDIDPDLMKKIGKVSLPLVLQYFFSIGGWQVFFIFVEHLGEKELAASQILRSVFGIISICTWAFAVTANIMVSNVIGQGRGDDVIPLIKKIGKLSLGITAAISLCFLVGGQYFLSFYRDDPALVALALPSLRIIVVAALVMSLATTAFNGVVGTGNTLVNLLIEAGCVGFYLIYCVVVIEHMHCSLTWAWVSEFVYWSCLLITSTIYLKTGRWRGKHV